MLLISVLGFVAVWNIIRLKQWRSKTISHFNATYDYIIVGSGSAGSVVASRLSEDPSISVLLLEAGGSGDNSYEMTVPALFGSLLNTEYDWKYRPESQTKACQAFADEGIVWPRGRVLGGSSSINTMLYVRGSRHDFDDWAANGCEGWSYKDVLPYFIKLENTQIPDLRNSEYRGSDGPMYVSAGHSTPFADLFSEAMEELGYETNDCNGESLSGHSRPQYTIKHGARCSTATAYLRPAMSRPNLYVSINSTVTKVIIEDMKALGVEVMKDNKKHVIRSNKEVILSAGTLESPHILMLSGIGPKEHLQKHGIDVVADLPVGQNLQDHLHVPLQFYPNRYVDLKKEWSSYSSWFNWHLFGRGFLTYLPVEGVAFLKTDANFVKEQPDIQLHFLSVSLSRWRRYLEQDEKDKGRILILPTLLHPKSRGAVTLRSKDPLEKPVIYPNFLSHPDDVVTLIKGISFALKLANTNAFSKYGMDDSHTNKTYKFCTEHTYGTDAFWECYVRHLATTGAHQTSTCTMGDWYDPRAVVDSQLRVKGISNLRVADASVMPAVTSGNTNAPTIMIGEKAADMILQRDSVRHIREKIKSILDNL